MILKASLFALLLEVCSAFVLLDLRVYSMAVAALLLELRVYRLQIQLLSSFTFCILMARLWIYVIFPLNLVSNIF